MRLVVAGGTGATGRHAVRLMMGAGHNVKAVSRRRKADAQLGGLRAEPIPLHIFDAGAATTTAAGADAVVNLATRIPAPPAGLRISAWEANSRPRPEASRALATAAMRACGRAGQDLRDRGLSQIQEPPAQLEQRGTQ